VHASLLSLCYAVCVAAAAPTSPRALFKLFVYHEEALQSSGYANWNNQGCGVFRNSTQAGELITFIRDPTNRVGMLSLDVQPLNKKSVQSTYFPQYDAIVAACTVAGIGIELMESNAVPGDSCQQNCPSVCQAKPNSANDSCTPSYMDAFHAVAYTLLNRYKNATMGVSYDIEQSDPASVPPSREIVWEVRERASPSCELNRGFPAVTPRARSFLFRSPSPPRPALLFLSGALESNRILRCTCQIIARGKRGRHWDRRVHGLLLHSTSGVGLLLRWERCDDAGVSSA